MDTHFFAGLTKFKIDAGKHRRDDDFADRFSHTFTTLLLVIFTLVVSARQYIGKPIACWVPTEFTRAQEEYAESVCWVTSTYFLPTQQVSVPESTAERNQKKILYYQWVPFVFMMQAFLFNLPCIIWRLFNWQSGIHLSSIMEVSCDIEMIRDPDSRRSNISYVARHIEDALTSQREYRIGCSVKCRHYLAHSCCLWFGKRYGNYLICLYLITKVFYILNVVGQFFLMNKILGSTYKFYGLDLIRDIAEGCLWEESGNFPRITMCDFEIRKLANKHRYTVQCVLPINMFNEKIFIFLWFWFILVSAVSISSFFYWAYKSSFRINRIHFIRKFLKLRGCLEPGEKKRSFLFVDHYLRQDGVFILRLVAQNAGELVASEIVDKLWHMFKRRQSVSTIVTTEKHNQMNNLSGNRNQSIQPEQPVGPMKSSKTKHQEINNTESFDNALSNQQLNLAKSQQPYPQVSMVGKPICSFDGLPQNPKLSSTFSTLPTADPPFYSMPPPLPPPPERNPPILAEQQDSRTNSSSETIRSRLSKSSGLGFTRGNTSTSKTNKNNFSSISKVPTSNSSLSSSSSNRVGSNTRVPDRAHHAIEEDPGEFV